MGTCQLSDSSVMIWPITTVHDFSENISLGKHEISKIGNWIAVQSLKIGGPIQIETKDHDYILQSGLMIARAVKNNSNNEYVRFTKLKEGFTDMMKTYKIGKHEEKDSLMLGMHLTATISIVETHLYAAYKEICLLKGELDTIRTWAQENFGESATSLTEQTDDILLRPAGDAMVNLKCFTSKVRFDEMHMERKLKGKCFKNIPLKKQTKNQTEQYFISLPGHKLTKNGHAIPCDKLRTIFIEDDNSTMYMVDMHGTIKLVEIEKDIDLNSNITHIKDQHGIPKVLAGDTDPMLEPLTLLQSVNAAMDAMTEIQEMHTIGKGSFFRGLLKGVGGVLVHGFHALGGLLGKAGSAIGNVIKDISSGTATIVHSAGDSVSEIVKAGGNATNEIEQGLGEIIKDGFGSFLTFGHTLAIALIIMYLMYEKYTRNRGIPLLVRRGSHAQDGQNNQV